jgi:2'-5' RNA ligase
MRLFFAIELEAVARERVAAEQRRLRRIVADTADIRWVDPAQLHLTLVFLGEVGEPRLTVVTALATQPIPVAPFTLTLGGVGAFPARGEPKIVWLGTRRGASETAAVHEAVAHRVTACGIEVERRRFHPHLTLARVRGRRGGGRFGRRLEHDGGAGPESVASLRVAEVTLFHSTLSPHGSTYEALARAPLAGPPLQ